MVLTGTSPTPGGGTRIQRITWTPLPDGRVRQHWQQSTDGGKIWTGAFIGLYAKR